MRLGAVVAVYRSAFIERQLQSMVRQELPLDEIVIVDDSGSDDWSEYVSAGLEGFHGRVDLIRNPRNLGMRRSYELAINRSTADIIFAADHDDEWLPEKTRVVSEALAETGAPGCFHDLGVFESKRFTVAEGRALGRFFDLYPGRQQGSSEFASLLEQPLASGSSLVMRKDILPTPIRFPDSVYPDMFLQLLIARSGEFLRIEQVLGNYRRHDENASPLPKGLDKLRSRTPDPDELVQALSGHSTRTDETLERFRLKMHVRRSVEAGTLVKWWRQRSRAVGSKLAVRELAQVYRQPWRFAADQARHLHDVFSRTR